MNELRVSDRGEWEQWLVTHREAHEVWLTIIKKGSKRPRVDFEEVIEEAIANGWIDSQMRPLNADEYSSDSPHVGTTAHGRLGIGGLRRDSSLRGG